MRPPTKMAVSAEILIHVFEAMHGLPAGEAGIKADELAAHYGVTRQTVFRWAGMKGLSWRKPRKDRGTSKVSDAVLEKGAALLLAARRMSNDFPLPTCDAKEILEDSGVDIGVSDSHFRTLLRQKKISIRDMARPAPHVTLLSEHPNHVWQFDVTNCLQYFIDEKKGMGHRDLEMTMYKNKVVKTAKKIRQELLRYVVVDHCTGAFYMRYFYTSGEKAVDGADFLYEAFRPKTEVMEPLFGEEKTKGLSEKYRLQGVPFMLVSDKGSILVAKRNQALLDALQVKLELHMAGNPRAKGAVEGLMKLINRFEARLKFESPRNLEELNRWAMDWTIMWNGVKNMRGVAPRSALWSQITNEQLRLCPEKAVYKMLIREPVITRTADGAQLIRINNRSYQVPDPACVKQKVKVVLNAYEYPAVDIHFNGHVWLVKPINTDSYGRLENGVVYGEYKRPKDTVTQKAKKKMETVVEDMGLGWTGHGDKRRATAPAAGEKSPLAIFGHQAEKVGNVAFIAKKGKALEVIEPEAPDAPAIKMDAIQLTRPVGRKKAILELFKELNRRSIPVSTEMNKTLRDLYGADIEMKAMEEVIRQLEDGATLADVKTAMTA